MRIRTTIHLALGTVLVLHIFTALMGHIGLEKSQRDLSTYEGVNSDTIRVLAIDKGIAELQRGVSTYMLNGHTSAADHVRDLLDSLRSEIALAKARTTQYQVADQLTEMNARFESFESNFEKVATDREARVQLVHEQMFPTKNEILVIIESSPALAKITLAPVRDHIYLAENAALRYFETPNRDKVNEAIFQIQQADMLINEIANPSTDAIRVRQLVRNYKQIFLEAVQATQGYMHLVHVVLAGETSELLYQSSQIRNESLAQRDIMIESMQHGSKSFQIWSDMVAILTVLAGIITAGLMTQSVLRPILTITSTLHQLSEGKSDAKIIHVNRTDEIGKMAKAAEVFRLRNLETEQLLLKSQQMGLDLERRNSEMTQFVYTVSHDLKSPLVTIQGFAGALKHAIENGDSKNSPGMVVRIQNASIRMSQTLEDLLKISRIGMVVNDFEEFRFGDCCNAVLDDMESSIVESHAVIKVTDGEDHILYADKIRIRQVLQNLIQNAIIHGHITDNTPEINVALTLTAGNATICVSDNGPGIDEQYHDKIFGIFQRLSTNTSGTGVGLAIVRKIANAHGGDAWIENQNGGGAAFLVSIPTKIELKSAA